MRDFAAARARAQTTMVDQVAVTRRATTAYAPGAELAETSTPVWSGPCSLLATLSNDRTATGGDDRLIGTKPLLLPFAASTAGIRPGDISIVAGRGEYVVKVVGERTNSITQRLWLSDPKDVEGVPR